MLAIPTFSQDYYRNLPAKRGEHLKVWDNYIDQAIKGDNKAIESVIDYSMKRPSKQYLSAYKYDLFRIFKNQPDKFINLSYNIFGIKEVCAYYLLTPNTGEIDNNSVKHILKNSNKKYYNGFLKFLSLKQEDRRKAIQPCLKIKIKK